MAARHVSFIVAGSLGLWASAANASLIDTATGGLLFAGANLAVDGVKLGAAGAPVALRGPTNPWVFMFADGTPAAQVFRSAVAAPGGTAFNSAVSAGFLGTGSSRARARGTPAAGTLFAAMATRGIASANALAGIGAVSISALPFATALALHLATIAIDPLSSPGVPVPQPAPPTPSGSSGPSFIPAEDVINAYLENESGDIYSLFSLDAKLTYDSGDSLWDLLDLTVTGPGGAPASYVTPGDFTFFDHGTSGEGYALKDISLNIPWTLPNNFLNTPFEEVLEVEAEGASTAAIPEPGTLPLMGLPLLIYFAGRRHRGTAHGA